MAKIDLPSSSVSGNAKPEKKFEKVTTGKVVAKEKNDIQKVASMFIAEDLRTVRDHIIKDVAIPSLKNVIVDLVWKSINMVMFGDDRPRTPSGTNYANTSRVSYNQYSNRNNTARTAVATPINYQDVIFSSRGDAEEVLSQMDKTITEYGAVSVADFCDMVGVTPNYADKKYGWYNTNCVYIDRKCDGYYILHLPAPITINW